MKLGHVVAIPTIREADDQIREPNSPLKANHDL
jgi:hypothetical protein